MSLNDRISCLFESMEPRQLLNGDASGTLTSEPQETPGTLLLPAIQLSREPITPKPAEGPTYHNSDLAFWGKD